MYLSWRRWWHGLSLILEEILETVSPWVLQFCFLIPCGFGYNFCRLDKQEKLRRVYLMARILNEVVEALQSTHSEMTIDLSVSKKPHKFFLVLASDPCVLSWSPVCNSKALKSFATQQFYTVYATLVDWVQLHNDTDRQTSIVSPICEFLFSVVSDWWVSEFLGILLGIFLLVCLQLKAVMANDAKKLQEYKAYNILPLETPGVTNSFQLFPEVSFVFFSSLFSRHSTIPQTVQTIESWANPKWGQSHLWPKI